MIIRVSNDIKIENPIQDVIDYCNDVLTIDNPDYLTAERLGKYTGRMPKKLKLYIKNDNVYTLPFGCLQDVWLLSKDKSNFKAYFNALHGNLMTGSINLYDYQINALKTLLKGKNGILEAPCGSGKTNIALQLIKELGGKALWLTHTGKLLNQSKTRCESYFKGDFGEITNGSVHIGRDITFATIQTMSKLDPSIYKDEFDIVIVDECHHCVGSPTKVMQFYKVVSNVNCRYKFGMSATLSRGDNMIDTLYSIVGKKLHTITSGEVGSKRISAIHHPVMISLTYDDELYRDIDGTIVYNNLINILSSDERRNRIIVDNVFARYNSGKHKQLLLCHRVEQVNNLAKEISKFCKVNIITGRINEKNRSFDGDVIVATYQLAKEGLDCPELDTLHLATPQKNDSTTEQSVGRIERNCENKETPICYDYVDENIHYCLSCFKKRKRILKKVKRN